MKLNTNHKQLICLQYKKQQLLQPFFINEKQKNEKIFYFI